MPEQSADVDSSNPPGTSSKQVGFVNVPEYAPNRRSGYRAFYGAPNSIRSDRMPAETDFHKFEAQDLFEPRPTACEQTLRPDIATLDAVLTRDDTSGSSLGEHRDSHSTERATRTPSSRSADTSQALAGHTRPEKSSLVTRENPSQPGDMDRMKADDSRLSEAGPPSEWSWMYSRRGASKKAWKESDQTRVEPGPLPD